MFTLSLHFFLFPYTFLFGFFLVFFFPSFSISFFLILPLRYNFLLNLIYPYQGWDCFSLEEGKWKISIIKYLDNLSLHTLLFTAIIPQPSMMMSFILATDIPALSNCMFAREQFYSFPCSHLLPLQFSVMLLVRRINQ